jgi:hypothetical protein
MEGFNITEQETLRLKIQRILVEWHHGQSTDSSAFGNLTIEETYGGYKVVVGKSDTTFFVSNKLVKQTKVFDDYSVMVDWDRMSVNRSQEAICKWEIITKSWNEGKMIPGEVATNLTYHRFFAQDSLPIKKLK